VKSFSGNSAPYLMQRLRRDAAAFAEALARGASPSVRAAWMCEGRCGLRWGQVCLETAQEVPLRMVRARVGAGMVRSHSALVCTKLLVSSLVSHRGIAMLTNP